MKNKEILQKKISYLSSSSVPSGYSLYFEPSKSIKIVDGNSAGIVKLQLPTGVVISTFLFSIFQVLHSNSIKANQYNYFATTCCSDFENQDILSSREIRDIINYPVVVYKEDTKCCMA